MQNQVKKGDFFVSGNGGLIEYVSYDETKKGTVLMDVRIPPGRVDATPYVEMCPPGAVLEAVDGVHIYTPPRAKNCGLQSLAKGHTESGANPDFTPTSASSFERQMRVMQNRLLALETEKQAQGRAKHAARLETVPKAKKPDPAPVVEDPAPNVE